MLPMKIFSGDSISLKPFSLVLPCDILPINELKDEFPDFDWSNIVPENKDDYIDDKEEESFIKGLKEYVNRKEYIRCD